MSQLSPVTFHGDTIFCLTHENQPYTPAKPIVENLGLGWASQSQKLNSNKARWGVTIIVIPSESGDQQMLCLPVRKLPAYLSSINPKKVRPELRAKIELYQNESDDALWNYWVNGRAERPTVQPSLAPASSLSPSARAELKGIVDAKLSTYPASVQGKARAEIWTRFNRHFRIAEYAQLPAERMTEARDYLIELEVKALKALPSTTPAPSPVSTFRTDFPADMEAGRKDALQKIRSIMDAMAAARSVVSLFCYPAQRTMDMPRARRLTYDAQHDFYAAALDCLSAAHAALEAGYTLSRQHGRG